MTQQQTAGPPTGQADLAEEFLDRQTPLSRIRNVLHRYPALSPAIVLLVAVVGTVQPAFKASRMARAMSATASG